MDELTACKGDQVGADLANLQCHLRQREFTGFARLALREFKQGAGIGAVGHGEDKERGCLVLDELTEQQHFADI